ncbi:MAG: hypothetical protein HY063_03420 [Bacteroidetes bacterium]|nr:hypothetical protein [Bacteroidota bacterium]
MKTISASEQKQIYDEFISGTHWKTLAQKHQLTADELADIIRRQINKENKNK